MFLDVHFYDLFLPSRSQFERLNSFHNSRPSTASPARFLRNDVKANHFTLFHVQIISTLNDRTPLCILDCFRSQLFTASVSRPLNNDNDTLPLR